METILDTLSMYNKLIQYDNGIDPSRPFAQAIRKTLQKDDDDYEGIMNVVIELSDSGPGLPSPSDQIQATMEETAYTYLVCTYLPYPFHVYASNNSIWGPIARMYTFLSCSMGYFGGTCLKFTDV